MSFAKNLRDLVKSNRQTGSNKLVASSNASSATSAPSSSSSVLSNITESSGIVSVSKTNFSTKPKSPDSGVSSRAQTPAVQASARSLSTGIVGDAEDQDDDISTPRQSLESAIGRIEQLNLDFTREDSAVPPTPRCFTARSRDLVGEIDRLMAYVDADVVHDYLQRSNQILRSLRLWFNSESQLPAPKSRSTRATDSVSTRGGNFLEFVHFWLTEFPGVERQELLRLEYENLCDELGFVFRVADTSSATRSSGELTTETISRASLHRLLEVVLPEYPGELCRANGAHRFLEMLDTLCCARNARFRNILSRLFTPNSATARSLSSSARSVASASSSSSSAAANQEAEVHPAFRKHMKWLLAIRAFAVLSFTQSPVEMFRNLQSMKPSHMAPASRPTQGPESSAAPSPIDPLDLIHLAIEYEHTDALLYVLRSRYESALLFEDPEGHNIIFLLIQRRKATLIESVLKQVRPSEAVALLSAVSRASGNTALHAAVNACSVPCVRALCAAIGVQRAGVGNESVRALVNQPNSASDDTTPLHLAIIHDEPEVVTALLESGAEPSKRTASGSTAHDLAKQLGAQAALEALEIWAQQLQISN